MTWHQARAVLDIEGMPTSQKIVLMALSLRAGNDGRAWPSIARLCDDTGLSDRTARRALHALADAGYLIVRRLPGRGLTMTITHAPARHSVPDGAVTVTGPARSQWPRPRSGSTAGAVTVTGRSNKEEVKKYATPAQSLQETGDAATNGNGNGPAPGETWGEYRERGGQ